MALPSVSLDLNKTIRTINNPNSQGMLDNTIVSLIDPTKAPSKQGSKALKILAIALIIISVAVILASIAFGVGIAITGATPFIAALKAPWAIVAAGIAGSVGIIKLLGSITLLKYARSPSEISIKHVYNQAPSIIPEVPAPKPISAPLTTLPPSAPKQYVTPPPPPPRISKPPIPIIKPAPPVPYKGLCIREGRSTNKMYGGLLQEIPLEVFNQNDWTSLQFPKNHIKFLPPAIGNFAYLTQLHMEMNNLTFLPDEIEFLTALKSLNVQYNQLRTLTPSINKLVNLEELVLWYNQLKTLPDIGNLTKLKTLNLQENKRLTSLPDCFENLTSLTEINLRSTDIEELPPSFRFLTNLSSLNLEYCDQLKEIPAFIWDLPKVRVSLKEFQKHLIPANVNPAKFYINKY